MLKMLWIFLLVSSTASAAESSRLNRAFQGVAEAAVSAQYVKDFAPHRADLAKHALAGGAISAVVGSLSTPDAGWKAGVIIGAGKELVNDALLGRGRPQVDDFVVTAAAAVLSSGISSDFGTLVYVDNKNAEIYFTYRF